MIRKLLPFVICIFFTGAGVFLLINGDRTAIWPTIFFGVCSVVGLFTLIRPNYYRWMSASTPEKSFDEIYNEDGVFTFTESGFTVDTAKQVLSVEWANVRSMIGYKEDLYTIDSICLDVFCDDGKGFKISEETPGWFQFLKHSKAALPSIDLAWEIEISTPAFETRLTLVYDKDGRAQDDVVKEVYKH